MSSLKASSWSNLWLGGILTQKDHKFEASSLNAVGTTDVIQGPKMVVGSNSFSVPRNDLGERLTLSVWLSK